jgi:hypothetical protein
MPYSALYIHEPCRGTIHRALLDFAFVAAQHAAPHLGKIINCEVLYPSPLKSSPEEPKSKIPSAHSKATTPTARRLAMLYSPEDVRAKTKTLRAIITKWPKLPEK